MNPIVAGPLVARAVGAVAGALLIFLGYMGIDTATSETIAVAEALAHAVVMFFGFLGYGLVHKRINRSR
jgi:hypothetical protein